MARDDRTELMRGTLDLLILKTLSLEPKHGMGISRRIEQITRGTFDVKAGSLFPSLYRLEQEGSIAEAAPPKDGHPRARYYRLTATGRKQLNAATEKWERVTLAVQRVLRTTT